MVIDLYMVVELIAVIGTDWVGKGRGEKRSRNNLRARQEGKAGAGWYKYHRC